MEDKIKRFLTDCHGALRDYKVPAFSSLYEGDCPESPESLRLEFVVEPEGGHACGFGDKFGNGDGSGRCPGVCSDNGSFSSGDIFRGIPSLSFLSYNGRRVYRVDGIPTVITRVKGDYAKGFTLGKDLRLTPCYVAKIDRMYAHGRSLREAHEEVWRKAYGRKPVEERIKAFIDVHPELDKPYDDLFEWHGILTGSCLMGREEWCRANGYKPGDSMTVREFIEKVFKDYGGETILMLARDYYNKS